MIRIGGGGKHGGKGRLDMGVCVEEGGGGWRWWEMLLIGHILIKW